LLLVLLVGTLIVITWDEDDMKHDNHIYTALLGSMITPGIILASSTLIISGSRDSTHYNHFSLLKTVEDNWNLGSLNRGDKEASPFHF